MNEHMDVRRPRQKAKRQIKRSNNVPLDDYMFDRKMQSLYYGAKPKSDDLPQVLKWLRNAFRRTKKELKALPHTIPHALSVLMRSIRRYPVRFLAGSLVLIVAVTFIAVTISRRADEPASQPPGNGTTQTENTSRIPLNQTPEFPVVLPQGKTADDVGGFAKVSPVGSPSTYAFKDKIGDVTVLVSEQQLPENMKTNTSGEVEKLAIGFNATQSVKTEKSEFFIGTNTNGAQSVITYTKTLLILLKSDKKISNERWQTYIEDLK